MPESGHQEADAMVRIGLDDEETRRIWETSKQAAAQFYRWPAWKRGEEKCPEPNCERAVGHDNKHGYALVSFVEW